MPYSDHPSAMQVQNRTSQRSRRTWCALVVAIASFMAGTAVAQTPLVVRHHFFSQDGGNELNYMGEVLELALEKSKPKYGPYVMQRFVTAKASKNRLHLLLENGGLDLMATMTNDERERTSLPVRYCLYRGLLGIRIGIGNTASVALANKVTTRAELNALKLGLVFDWPDYAIQHDAGLNVLRLPDFDSSIQRLKLGTFDLMPMGIVEAAPLAKDFGLELVDSWAIAYPTAFYFFVSKTKPELAERLRYGMEQATKDNSFKQLFDKRLGAYVAAAHLEQRKIFYIPNPYLPKATPLDRKELWHPLAQTLIENLVQIPAENPLPSPPQSPTQGPAR